MLKFEEVKKSYHHDRGLIRANLTIEIGKLYLLVGENGSGKSTTLKLISKVIFHKEREGKIENNFKKMVFLPDKRSYPKLITISEFLRLYLGVKKKYPCIKEGMDRYLLPDKKIGGLSKGMLQKLGILQSILSDGDLYLFDEPTDGLDKHAVDQFKEDIHHLLNNGKTIIISTHNKQTYRELKPIIYQFKEGICNEKK